MKHHFTSHISQALCTLLFGVAVLLFFGMAYPHHLHYQEQYQLFLFDSNYVWDIIRMPGGVADLLGRFCTQFFQFAWVGAAIIAVLLSLVQLLTLRLAKWGWLYGLSFVPSFLLWLFLLDEHALLGGVWAVLLTQFAVWGLVRLKGWTQRIAIPVILFILYWIAFGGSHYYRYPTVFPTLLYVAWVTAVIIPLAMRFVNSLTSHLLPLTSFILVAAIMGTVVWKNANFKAEKVMQYDFMARHQQWNRILETINTEKPNNQIGVTVQNLALAMHGQLINHLLDYNQNGIAGLLPDVQSDATSPLPTAEVHYQLGMISVAQRTVFEAQEAILDFQKSGRCYKRLAQTNLILGSYEVARKYLMALQKTLFYRDWANETLPLLGNEEAIAKHPEYGRLRQMVCDEDYYFSDHVTPEMLEGLYACNTDNHLALEYLKAYYVLTGDRENYAKLLLQNSAQQ
ncbi:MAG: hypothetical protein E7107_06475 [Prevotella sp.]|jgi:hypothetical protein|nr:hypothetical protein [Prevotella sp.]MCR5365128.1 DUF6057 family protein [Prevotella sp.]